MRRRGGGAGRAGRGAAEVPVVDGGGGGGGAAEAVGGGSAALTALYTGGVERKLGDSKMTKLLHITWSDLICNGQITTVIIVHNIGNGS